MLIEDDLIVFSGGQTRAAHLYVDEHSDEGFIQPPQLVFTKCIVNFVGRSSGLWMVVLYDDGLLCVCLIEL